jgi:hypothetical protein
LKTSINKAVTVSLILGALVLSALLYSGYLVNQGPLSDLLVPEAADQAEQGSEPVVEGEISEVADEIARDIAAADRAFENPKVQLLAEILESRNDNDPRLDSDLKNLSAEDKKDLRLFYKQLELEDRNGRGTAVFLLGRNLVDESDLEFFKEVLVEKPCFSLMDCEMAEPAEMAHVDEHDHSQDVTLAYPQIVALRSIEVAWGKAGPELRKKMMEILQAAAQNENPKVSQMASRLSSQFRPN